MIIQEQTAAEREARAALDVSLEAIAKDETADIAAYIAKAAYDDASAAYEAAKGKAEGDVDE